VFLRGLVKKKPTTITDNYTPSDDLIDWCKQMGITSHTMEREKIDFIFWNKEKKKKIEF